MNNDRKDFDILVIGELNVDLILDDEVTPEFNQKEKLVKDATLVLGSSSAIFACGAARLGLKVAFLGLVGDDVFGHFVINELKARKVFTPSIRVDPKVKTGSTIILNRGNDRAILTHPGSMAEVRKSDLELSLFSSSRHLHLGGYFLLQRLKKNIPAIFRLAHQNKLTVSLDTNYDPSERWEMGRENPLKETDVFLPNETEIKAITHQPNVSAALVALKYIPTIAVKKGSEGAIARQNGIATEAKALRLKVQDTVGAGDSFDAGFIYGLLAGFNLEKTLQFATICGSLSICKAGGIAGQATLLEARRYLKSI